MTRFKELTILLGLFMALQGCGSGADNLGLDTSGRGCGSGWNTDVVRDEFWDVSFRKPCENHDLCYETCGVTKEECDVTFHNEMKSVCEDTFPDDIDALQKMACLAAADLYYEGVSTAGEGAFSAAQTVCR